mmetsp:Transcript_46469/g.77396  ORF Transcript_46469/g.77396 Transcript_46469/m.77396 type:complete len:158 (-) Transcript_46469:1649-2122(-)
MVKPPASRVNDLAHALDREVEILADNFLAILKASKIIDKTANERQKFEIETRTSSIVVAAESLYKIVNDTKLSALLHDITSMNAEVKSQVERFDKARDEANSKLTQLSAEVASALHELETHYYSSRHRRPGPVPPPDLSKEKDKPTSSDTTATMDMS